MPMYQTLLSRLNAEFSEDRIDRFQKEKADRFAPGRRIEADLMCEPGTPLHRAFEAYLTTMPGAVHEALRATIAQALSTSPPTPIAFAWAPGYDFEITVWQAPDSRLTKGGITVLLKTRYPDDAHPLASSA